MHACQADLLDAQHVLELILGDPLARVEPDEELLLLALGLRLGILLIVRARHAVERGARPTGWPVRCVLRIVWVGGQTRLANYETG